MRSVPLTALPIAALLVALAGCATSEPLTSSPGSPAAATPSPTLQASRVVLEKSGGLQGVQDKIAVEPDGRWTVNDHAGSARTGQLSASDLAQLRQLIADSRLAGEATATAPATSCADAFTYQLTVAGRTSRYVDCPADSNQPRVTAAVVTLLTRATG